MAPRTSPIAFQIVSASRRAARSNPYYLGGDERYRFEISFDIDVSARTAELMAV